VGKLRIGILGAGNIAQSAHLPVYAARDDVELVAICDMNLARAKARPKSTRSPRL
jgi:predicted dehydrogenase